MKTNTWIALGAFVFVASFAAATSFNSPSQRAASLSSTVADKALIDANKVGPGTGTVVQTPQKVFVMGGLAGTANQPSNDVYSSTDGVNWSLVTANAQWSKRMGQESIYFNGKLWVMGGIITGGSTNDIWNSTDGVNWTQVTPVGQIWPARYAFQLVKFNDGAGEKMWVLGGRPGSVSGSYYNDIWNSADGVHWNQVIPTSNFSQPSPTFSVVVYQNQLWAIRNGGAPPTSWSDSLSSPDGITWTQHTITNPNYSGFNGGVGVTFDDGTGSKIFMLGRTFVTNMLMKYVFSSTDGMNWIQRTNPTWSGYNNNSGIMNIKAITFNPGTGNRIWILGGWTPSNGSPIWSTSDGDTWNMDNPTPVWGPRSFNSLAVTPLAFGLADLQPTTLTWNGIGNMAVYNNNPIPTSNTNMYVYFSATIKNTSTTLPITVPANTKFEIRIMNTATGLLYTTAVTTIGTPFTIAPNGTKTLTFTAPQNPNMLKIPGTYTTTLNVDANNLVSESNEINNTLAKTLIIQ